MNGQESLKKTRIEDKELLEEVRGLPCIACVSVQSETKYLEIIDSIGKNRSHPHHVKTKGSGGNDVAGNLMPLCFKHHSEIHRIGLESMSLRYSAVGLWLTLAGWLFSPAYGWQTPESSSI